MAQASRSLDGYLKDDVNAGFIDPREIEIRPGFNPRSPEDLEAGIQELMPQIVAYGGVHNPVVIYRDGPKAVLLGGETRVRSIIRLIEQGHPDFKDGDAKWPKGRVCVPFRVDTVAGLNEANTEEFRLLRALSDNAGRGLTDFDKGAAYTRLMAFGHTVEDLVSMTGLSHRYITSCLELAPAPAELKEAVAAGQISRGAAVQAVKKGSTHAREVAAEAKASPKPMKRKKAAPQPKESALRKAALAVLKEFEEEFSNDTTYENVSISVKALEALRKAL